MIFQAPALEILHNDAVLLELIGDGVAPALGLAVRQPEAQEAVAGRVLGLAEIDRPAGRQRRGARGHGERHAQHGGKGQTGETEKGENCGATRAARQG